MKRPQLEPLAEKSLYRLTEDWTFRVDGLVFVIAAGFEYDGASIPSAAWRLTYTPFDPVVMTAALEHDYFCVYRPPEISSIRAAEHFRDGLIYAEPHKRRWMYKAVKYFGPQWGHDNKRVLAIANAHEPGELN